MVLRGDPSHVNVSWILSREYPYPVEIFVHQFQAFRVEYLVSDRLDAAPCQNGHCFGRVAFWDLGRYHFQVRLRGGGKKSFSSCFETKRFDHTRLDERTNEQIKIKINGFTFDIRIWGGRLLALFIDSVLVLLSETSERIGGSGVFDFASGDFAFREKNLWNIFLRVHIFFDTYMDT